MLKIPPRENLDYTISTVKRKCICPDCLVVFEFRIELAYLDSPYAWKYNNYPVVLCSLCRENNYKRWCSL